MAIARFFRWVGILELGIGLFFWLAYALVTNEAVKWGFALAGTVLLLGACIWFTLSFAISRTIQRRVALRQHLDQHGIATPGTITSLSINRNLRYNRQRPFMVVEYSFQDGEHHTHTARDAFAPAAVVKELKWEVGSSVMVKYFLENPQKSTLVELIHSDGNG